MADAGCSLLALLAALALLGPASGAQLANHTAPANSSAPAAPLNATAAKQQPREQQQEQPTDLASMYVQIPIAEPADTGAPEQAAGDQAAAADAKPAAWTGPWPKKFQIGYIKQSDLHQVLLESLQAEPFAGQAKTGAESAPVAKSAASPAWMNPAGAPAAGLTSGGRLAAQAGTKMAARAHPQLQQLMAAAQSPSYPAPAHHHAMGPPQHQQQLHAHQPRQNQLARPQHGLQQQQQHGQLLQRHNRYANPGHQHQHLQHPALVGGQQAHSLRPRAMQQPQLQQVPQVHSQLQQQLQFEGVAPFAHQPVYMINQQQQRAPMNALEQLHYQLMGAARPQTSGGKSDNYFGSSWRPVSEQQPQTQQQQLDSTSGGTKGTSGDAGSTASSEGFDDGFTPGPSGAEAAPAMNRHPMLNTYLSSAGEARLQSPASKAKHMAKSGAGTKAAPKPPAKQAPADTKASRAPAAANATASSRDAPSSTQSSLAGEPEGQSRLDEDSGAAARGQAGANATSTTSTTTSASTEAGPSSTPASTAAAAATTTEQADDEADTAEPDSESLDATEPATSSATPTSTASSAGSSPSGDQDSAEVATQSAVQQQAVATGAATGGEEAATSSAPEPASTQREDTTPASAAAEVEGARAAAAKSKRAGDTSGEEPKPQPAPESARAEQGPKRARSSERLQAAPGAKKGAPAKQQAAKGAKAAALKAAAPAGAKQRAAAAKAAAPARAPKSASAKNTRMAADERGQRLQAAPGPQLVSMSAAQAQSTAQTLAQLLLARCMAASNCAHLLDVCSTKQASVQVAAEAGAAPGAQNASLAGAWAVPVGLGSSELMSVARALQADRVLRLLGPWKDAAENVLDHGPQAGYTLLLPSNEAVERLPAGQLEAWLASGEQLAQLIDSHIADTSEPLGQPATPRAPLGSRLVRAKGWQVNEHRERTLTVNGRRLVYANQPGPAGGRIHVIDGFLDWPPGPAPGRPLDIVETLKQCDKFDGFVTLAEGTGLTQILRQDGPMTVFVPSNEALRKIPDEELELIKNNSTALKDFLLYHVVNGSYFSQDLRDGQQLASLLHGRPVQVGVRVDGCSRRLVEANTSPMRRADIVASNGVIHILDWYLTVRDNEWCDSARPADRLQQLASEPQAAQVAQVAAYATRMRSLPANHKPAAGPAPADAPQVSVLH